MNSFHLQKNGTVLPEWIDKNGHMNVVSYFNIFEKVSWNLWETMAERASLDEHLTMVAGRFYIEHRKELLLDDEWEVWSCLVPNDQNSILMVHRIKGQNKGIVATCEIAVSLFNLNQRCHEKVPQSLINIVNEFSIIGLKPRLFNLMNKDTIQSEEKSISETCFIVIFVIKNKGNHVGVYFPGIGMADLSLAGSRIISIDDEKLPVGALELYPVIIKEKIKSLNFFGQIAALCPEIISKERAQRGWHLTQDAPDFVLQLRKIRSEDVNNMNCVEWIALGMKLGGVDIPKDILTPEQLRNWCKANNL